MHLINYTIIILYCTVLSSPEEIWYFKSLTLTDLPEEAA